MLDGQDGERLLKKIADALGTDARTFRIMAATAEPARSVGEECCETAMLLRLIRLWRALPDAESRRETLRYVEALVATPIRAD